MKVIIAVDGSDQSNGALQLTRTLPLSTSQVTVVHVKPSMSYEGIPLPPEAQVEIESFNKEIDTKTDALVNAAVAELKKAGLNVHSEVFCGRPAETIITYAKDVKADLIIMGARGHNPLQSLIIGSVADTVMRHAYCSVLLWRSAPQYSLPKGAWRFLVGYDDSPMSQKVVEHLKTWDLSKVETIRLVSYAQMSFYYGMSYSMSALGSWPAFKKSLEESLVAANSTLQRAGKSTLSVESDIVTDGHDIANELCDYAQKHRFDMIVVGSKGKNLLDRIMLGSVSGKLAHHSPTPVLIVR